MSTEAEARQRARNLLWRFLTTEQQIEYLRHQRITVPVNLPDVHGAVIMDLSTGGWEPECLWARDGNIEGSFCVHANLMTLAADPDQRDIFERRSPPIEDIALTHLLMLQTDPKRWLTTANFAPDTYYNRPPRIGVRNPAAEVNRYDYPPGAYRRYTPLAARYIPPIARPYRRT